MRRALATALAVGLAAAACGAGDSTTQTEPLASVPGVVEPTTSTTVASSPVAAVADTDLATLVTANNDFAIDMLNALLPEAEPNLALGPWSISEGLALPWVGARGDTETEMAEALNYLLPTDTQHAAFHTLRSELRDRNADGVSLTTANRLFGQEGLAFLDEFLADQSRYYEAPLATVDFAADGEAARQAINDWTAAQTNDRITDLFPEGSIDSNTLLALVNAIHFEADWKYVFDPERTRLEPFTTSDGDTTNVEMMHYDWSLPRVSSPELVAVRLPYAGDEMSMVAVLPSGDLDAYVAALDATAVADLQAQLIEEGGVHLALPKFDISSHHSLVDPLRSMGMELAFDQRADFSGITPGGGLSISAIEHEAFITIDETGTEAGAATGTAMPGSHGPGVVLNRPFLFWVQDDATGAILFLGRVGDPDPTG